MSLDKYSLKYDIAFKHKYNKDKTICKISYLYLIWSVLIEDMLGYLQIIVIGVMTHDNDLVYYYHICSFI